MMSRLGMKIDRNLMIILLGIIALNTTCDEGLFNAMKFLVTAYCFLTAWEIFNELGITKYIYDKLKKKDGKHD